MWTSKLTISAHLFLAQLQSSRSALTKDQCHPRFASIFLIHDRELFDNFIRFCNLHNIYFFVLLSAVNNLTEWLGISQPDISCLKLFVNILISEPQLPEWPSVLKFEKFGQTDFCPPHCEYLIELIIIWLNDRFWHYEANFAQAAW